MRARARLCRSRLEKSDFVGVINRPPNKISPKKAFALKVYLGLLAVFLPLLLSPATSAAPLVKACEDAGPRDRCGSWSVGGYYSVSPQGYWFAGLSGGGEYFVLRGLSLGTSLSPGFGDGYFYLAPSLDLNYYLWHNESLELVAGYSLRYFYDWPTRKGESESSGTFHGPGISIFYGVTQQLYTGVNISYQWIQFAGDYSREWYFTLPVFWAF